VNLRRLAPVLCGLSLLAGPVLAEEQNHIQDFKRKLIWKGPLIKTAASALFEEARNSPHEWGRGIDGFGKRVGSAFAKRTVKAGVELGFSGFTHEDLHYQRMGSGRFWARVKHAVVTTYWVPRDDGPGHTLAVGRIAGSFAAPQVARLWMPDRIATFGAAMESTGATLGLDVGLNVLYEFWHRKR
jgi:hypothetical protein